MKIKKIFKHLKKKYFPTDFDKTILKWFEDDGDNTLRLDYNLTPSSVVFDLGGYKGQWTSDIYAKYNCNIFVFEPVNTYAEQIKKRFINNSKIEVFNFGLANKSYDDKIAINDDGSSLIKKNGRDRYEKVRLKDMKEFLEENNIREIDLIKINIEGGEYDLMDYILSTGIINKINNLQIQFHDFVEDSYNRRENIQMRLMETHLLSYNYEFVWENWVKNSDEKIEGNL